jgi:hypothetical protein
MKLKIPILLLKMGQYIKKDYHIPKSKVESFDVDALIVRVSESELKGFEEEADGDQKFEGYSSFKSSDMSKNLKQKSL